MRCIRNSVAVAETTGHPVRAGGAHYSVAKKLWSSGKKQQGRGRGSPTPEQGKGKAPWEGKGVRNPGFSLKAPEQMVKGPLFGEVGC